MREHMHEVRIHGRGGQGVVLASKILAKALVEEGQYVIAVPQFGFERRGAPVVAYLRYDQAELRALTNIYDPDCVICLDPTVSRAVDIYAGLKNEGTLIQTTSKPPAEVKSELPETVSRLGLCDAVGIAMEIFGRPITNSIMLGAYARTTGDVSLEALQNGFQSVAFRDAGLDQNMQAIQRGYDETSIHEMKGSA